MVHFDEDDGVLGGVGSRPEVEFDFNHVHLSEPIAEARLEAKILIWFDRLIDTIPIMLYLLAVRTIDV